MLIVCVDMSEAVGEVKEGESGPRAEAYIRSECMSLERGCGTISWADLRAMQCRDHLCIVQMFRLRGWVEK